MIADFAIHDKGDGNPHAHIPLPCRGMENGQVAPQERSTTLTRTAAYPAPVRELEKPQRGHRGLERPEVRGDMAAGRGRTRRTAIWKPSAARNG